MYPYIKRGLDFLFALIGCIILVPIFTISIIIIWINMGRPVFFRQERPGFKGKSFTMYKFRSMLDLRDENGNPLSNEQRITKLGRFLRSTSLDELPELYNVIKGDMSLVGPRPLLMEYLERYNSRQARRHDVKPGITGWAQVNGRNLISWEDKFELDVWYVDNCTIYLDLKIICLTLFKVIKREGISPKGQATVTKFMGS